MIEFFAFIAAVLVGYFSGRSAFLTLASKGFSRLTGVFFGVVFGLFSWSFFFAGAMPYATGQDNAFALTVAIWSIVVIPWALVVYARRPIIQKIPKPPIITAERPAAEKSPSERYQDWYAEASRLGHSTGWDDWKKWESTGVFVTAKEKYARDSSVVDYVLRNANRSFELEKPRRSKTPRRPFRVKKSLSITYEDANGDVSHRTIDTITFDGVKIEAWCHLRSEDRTFYASRILCCIDESTGEIVDDVADFLLNDR